jgi:hypothetical protein
MPFSQSKPGSSTTPTLADVLDTDNDAESTGIDNLGDTTLDGNIIARGNLILGINNGDAPALSLPNDLAGHAVVRGGSPGAAVAGGAASLEAGAGSAFGSNGAAVVAGGGNADGVTPGRLIFSTADSVGTAGQALVSDGANKSVWGGLTIAAGVPAGAPNGKLPFAIDTTAVTGGAYYWNGSAWVKFANAI